MRKRVFGVLLILCIMALGLVGFENMQCNSGPTHKVYPLNNDHSNSSESTVDYSACIEDSDTSYEQEEHYNGEMAEMVYSDFANDGNIWEIPPNRFNYESYYFWGLRDEYSIPILKEIEFSKEEELMVRAFFEANPTLHEEIWDVCKGPAIVYLMDVTGDGIFEILIQYHTVGEGHLFGGRLAVYDLESGCFLGNIWRNCSGIDGVGWYRNKEDGTTAFYVMDVCFYYTKDETYISADLQQVAYTLSRIEYNDFLSTDPIWLYNITIRFNPHAEGLEELFHYSLLDYSHEDLVQFTLNPPLYYYTLRERWTEGCNLLIRDSILHLQPIETEYCRGFAYIDGEGVHLRTNEGTTLLKTETGDAGTVRDR